MTSVSTPSFILDHGWLKGVRHCTSPNFNPRPAANRAGIGPAVAAACVEDGLADSPLIDLLVIHNISLPAGHFGSGYVEQLFCNTLDCSAHPDFDDLRGVEVSAHFFVARDGAVTQFVSTEARAWHAGVSCFEGRSNCNDFSIGIELEGTDYLPFADAQYVVLQWLVHGLMQYYPLLTTDHIVGHSDIAPQRKTDPGPAFDWSRLRNSVQG